MTVDQIDYVKLFFVLYGTVGLPIMVLTIALAYIFRPK